MTRTLLIPLAVLVLAGCPQDIRVAARSDATARDVGPTDLGPKDAGPGDGEPGDRAELDGTASDATFPDATYLDATVYDATFPDASFPDATFPDATVVPDAGALDPFLAVPPAGNDACYPPGDYSNACPGIAVCRFYDGAEGRCEACTECGNLNAFCVTGDDCDILFACYAGRCTNFCTLGTYNCGPIDDCLDVGFPGIGVCRPF